MVPVADIITLGYNTRLAFRDEKHSLLVFDSITGLSQIYGELAEQLRQVEMTKLEKTFYDPSHTKYESVFHKKISTKVVS
jgi:hypothetical protein